MDTVEQLQGFLHFQNSPVRKSAFIVDNTKILGFIPETYKCYLKGRMVISDLIE
jgi:hypothetical protein